MILSRKRMNQSISQNNSLKKTRTTIRSPFRTLATSDGTRLDKELLVLVHDYLSDSGFQYDVELIGEFNLRKLATELEDTAGLHPLRDLFRKLEKVVAMSGGGFTGDDIRAIFRDADLPADSQAVGAPFSLS